MVYFSLFLRIIKIAQRKVKRESWEGEE